MRVTLNRVELLAAASRAASVAPAASPLDVLKGVLLEADSATGKLIMTATNLEVALEQKIPCPIQENDALVVNAHLLEGMLGKLGGEIVELDRVEEHPVLTVKSGAASYCVPVWERNSFPKPELPFIEDTVKVSGIPAMARRTVFAAEQDNQKPLLKCVNLRFTKDGLKAVGSNGSCIISARGDNKSTGDISFLVPALSLAKLARMSSDKDEFRVGTTGRELVFIKDNFLFSARLMSGDYINTDQLIAAISNQFTVLTDVPELKNALYSASSLNPDGKVELRFERERLTLSCDGDYGSASTQIEVIPLTGLPQGSYWYLTRQLGACLHSLEGTLTLGVAQGGMLTINTEDAFYMQTAMRPGKDEAKPKAA